MATRYVPMSSEALEAFLQKQGFSRTVQHREVVYIRKHHKNPDLQVKVYTSLRDGASQVRDCGADAIRVCTVFESASKSFGVGKFPKLLRTAPTDMTETDRVEVVLGRLYLRMREAYARANEFNKTKRAS